MKLLSSCYLFKELSESQLLRLSKITREVKIQKGQFFMKEGQQAEELFVLKEGAVELLTKVEDGFELPIAIFRNPGDCTGTSALVAPYVYSINSRCVEDCEMLVIKKAALKDLMQQDHELGCTIMRNMARHLLDRLKETRQELKIHFKTIFRSTQS
ncbi:MAG: cyclic nucleotide-binding domain-containing protein [Desulfobacterales bacterium]